jgi:hypothetical protein
LTALPAISNRRRNIQTEKLAADAQIYEDRTAAAFLILHY